MLRRQRAPTVRLARAARGAALRERRRVRATPQRRVARGAATNVARERVGAADVSFKYASSAQFVAAESHETAFTSRTPVETDRQWSMAARSQLAAASWLSMEGGGE